MKKIFSLEFFLKKRGPEIKGHRGSVTVFLSAIMVPMMLLMLTFFDLAKYEAAKPIVSEAGNMALNAGLTEFNVSLKDFYGLFAISKSEEELGENLEKYFIATLNANGITEEDIYDSRTLTAIKDMFGHPQDVDVTNLMNLVEKEFSVEFMQGGNLANPILLKNQIMDYMEYRGPIVLAGGLLDKLNLFKGVDKVEDTVTCKSEYEQDTAVPFDAGSLRMAETNGQLYVRTCHEMYKADDGINHQANMTIIINENDMTVADLESDFWDYSQNNQYFMSYASHSFNQFILSDRFGDIVFLDHGDAFPRAALIAKVGREKWGRGQKQEIVSYGGDIGDNWTNSTVGGLEYAGNNYLTVGTVGVNWDYDDYNDEYLPISSSPSASAPALVSVP